MTDILASFPEGIPSDLALWLVGALATQLYRTRRRAIDAEVQVAVLTEALKERDGALKRLAKEVLSERSHSDALLRELHDMRNP